MPRSYSLGEISTTRYWVSYESRPWAWWRWYWSPGKTYNGTTDGIVIGLPFAVIIGHKRDVHAFGHKPVRWDAGNQYRGWKLSYYAGGLHSWYAAERHGVRMRSRDRAALRDMIDQRGPHETS